MKKIFLFLIFSSVSYPQIQNELHSQENIRKFADYLFSEKDYLRAAIEYERLPLNDTINFKTALAYAQIEKYDLAIQKFKEIKTGSFFYEQSRIEKYKIDFQAENYQQLQIYLDNTKENHYQRLLYLSYLFTSHNLPEQQQFLNLFPEEDKKSIMEFYNHKKNPAYKSQLLSGILSAIIPGSGKIYLGEIGDGIAAFLATSVFTFLSYDNFTHDHKFRGWLFSGLGFFFYAGNIYGSVAAAQIYNAEIDHQYNANLKEYLKNKNYFLPENEFIK